ncbi:MAG: glycoside hydrolase family 2 TIM barrel-domain containing protein, partial [bacterium]
EFIKKWRLTQRVLLAFKALNFNNLNPQAIGANLPGGFYDSCDEIGMLLYDLNPYYTNPYELARESVWLAARYTKEKQDDLKLNPTYLANVERYFLRNYNHPSCVMFAVSSELRDAVYTKAHKAVCDLLKRIDGQGRPVCPCSGDAPSQTSFTFSEVADIHVYPGDINSHPWDHKQLIYDFNQDVWTYIGKNIPVVNYEAGGFFHVVAPKELNPIRQLWTNATPDKAAIIRNIEGKDADYNMPMNARWLTMYGIRRFAVDDYNRAQKAKVPISSYRQEYMLRNQIGSSRLAGDLFQGFGINFARFYTAFAAPAKALSNEWPSQFDFSELRFFWRVGPTFVENPIVAANGFNAMRRHCNPTLVMLDLLASKDCFAGKSFKTTLYAINDNGDDSGEQRLRVVICDPDNRRLFDRTAAIGVVPAAKRKLIPFEWSIPADMPSSTLRVELFLLEGGKVVSDNSFDFHVLGRNQFVDRIPNNGKRVALYDSAAENGSPERSTAKVMDQLGIKYKRLKDFKGLNKFDVLIIGAASVDNQVFKADQAIG